MNSIFSGFHKIESEHYSIQPATFPDGRTLYPISSSKMLFGQGHPVG